MMVPQPDPPKTSSAAAEAGVGARFAKAYRSGSLSPKEKRRFEKFLVRELLKSPLLELANLPDEGIERFWRGPFIGKKPAAGVWRTMWGHLPAETVLRLRDELRRLWEPATPSAEKAAILQNWFQPTNDPFLFVRVERGRFQLKSNPANLHSVLWEAVFSYGHRFAKCHNPGCPAPYFLLDRKTQKF